MKKTLVIVGTALVAAVGTITFLANYEPPLDPVVTEITGANLGELRLDHEVKGYCQPVELFCAHRLYEPVFTAPETADPVEICNDVIDLQARIGLVAYGAAGANAGKVSNLQAVKDFCVEGFTKPYVNDDGSKIYEGTNLFDDGSNDKVGKVTVINWEPGRGFTVVFSISRNLDRVGWISYGEGTPRHYSFAPAE